MLDAVYLTVSYPLTLTPFHNMKIIDAINAAETTLAEAGIETARLDAEVLLAHVTSRKRAELYLDRHEALTAAIAERFDEAVHQRALGCPVAYITGVKEFWSIPLRVTPDVLIPRPDTETLVEAALASIPGEGADTRILDLCTGSGCIAAALARELPEARLTVSDLSERAIAVAHTNLAFADERTEFLTGDLFAALSAYDSPQTFDIIVSNPPYISEGEMKRLPRDIARFEPREALAAGESGLDFIARITQDAPRYLRPGGWLHMEIGMGQAGACIAIATGVDAYDTVKTSKDLSGIDRVVSIRRSWTG